MPFSLIVYFIHRNLCAFLLNIDLVSNTTQLLLLIFDQMQFCTISIQFPFIYLVSWWKGPHIFPYFLLTIPLLMLFLLYKSTYFFSQLPYYRVMKGLIWILHTLGLSLHNRSFLNFHFVFCLLLIFPFVCKCQIFPAYWTILQGRILTLRVIQRKILLLLG